MYEENPLDRMIHQFQDRWETNPQYRAAMSGTFALLLVVFIAISATGASFVVGGAMTALGFGGGNTNSSQQQGLAGIKLDNGQLFFPTQTTPPWTDGATPGAGTIQPSGTTFPTATPLATATEAPSPTPCRSNCGSGGGTKVTITATWSTSPSWGSGLGTLTMHTADSSGNPVPHDGINVIISGPGFTILSNGGGPQYTDASGNWTWNHPGLPSTCSPGQTVAIKTEAVSGGVLVGGPTITATCP